MLNLNSTGKIFSLILIFLIGLSHLGYAAVNPFDSSQQFKFQYQVEVPNFKGESLKIWVPFPAENKDQKIISYDVKTNQGDKIKAVLKTEKKFGNRMLYFEVPSNFKPVAPKLEIIMNYTVERHPSVGVALSKINLKSELRPNLYKEHNQWITVNETIRKMAKKATVGANTESEKIRALYDFVVSTISYNKSGKGWGKGDPIWACDAKRGNCTDFHSLYISMARELGLSARFEIGVPVPTHLKRGEIPGYHCWANAFDSKKGWQPLDASEAKKSGKTEEYFGKLPSDRILFSVGRDLTLNPAQKSGPLNYFIFPHIELDGKTFSRFERKFSFEKL